MSKECKECKIEKEFKLYNISKCGTNGYSNVCKDCRSKSRKSLNFKAPDEGTKYCSKCKLTLDISKFNKDKSNSTGLHTYCKDCSMENTKKWASTEDGYFKKIFVDLQQNAKKRNIKVNITADNLKELYEKQNGICALSGIKMTRDLYLDRESNNHIVNKYNISVDRIDSNKDYDKDNIQLVCAIVNRIKIDLNNKELIEMCKVIVNNRNSKKS